MTPEIYLIILIGLVAVLCTTLGYQVGKSVSTFNYTIDEAKFYHRSVPPPLPKKDKELNVNE